MAEPSKIQKNDQNQKGMDLTPFDQFIKKEGSALKSDEFYGSEYDEEVSVSQQSSSQLVINNNLKKSVDTDAKKEPSENDTK